jgi:hypothetical protein
MIDANCMIDARLHDGAAGRAVPAPASQRLGSAAAEIDVQ